MIAAALGHSIFFQDKVPDIDYVFAQTALFGHLGAISKIDKNRFINYVEPRSYTHALTYPDGEEWVAATRAEID